MKPLHPLSGLYAYAVTPTHDGDAIDHGQLAELLDEVIDAGVDGVTIFGSTGGIGSFAEAERMETAERAIAHVARRIPVIIGTGALTTAEAIRLSVHAERAGAAAVLVVPITYWILNEQELYEHYRAIARAVRIPVCIYNNPRLTVIDLQPPLIARLAQIENVRYLKETSTDLMRISAVKRLTADSMHIAGGRDGAILEALKMGAESWHSATANVIPHLCVELYRSARKDLYGAETARLYQQLLPFTEFAVQKGLIRSVHTAFELLGRPKGPPRKPIQMLNGEDREHLGLLLAELTSIGTRAIPSARVEGALL